jgi:hypothetical protein
MKRLTSAALIVLLICGAAFPALARGGHAGGHGISGKGKGNIGFQWKRQNIGLAPKKL